MTHEPRPAPRLLLTAALGLLTLGGCKSAAPPDDATLSTAVENRLSLDAALRQEPIQTTVQAGVVILQGNVSNEAAKSLAATEAAQVGGIRTVVNQLTVGQPAPAQTATVAINRTSAPPLHPPDAKPTPARRTPESAPRQPPSPLPSQAQTAAPIERRENPELRENPDHRETRAAIAAPPPARPEPSFRELTLPAGTSLSVRLTQTLDSATTQPGDTFSGSLASDVTLEGVVALPAGTAVNGRVDQVHEASHFKGSSLLTLSLASLSRHGDRTPLATDPYTREGKGRGTNTAEKVGGGAAVGAILGGIFGGGKGAAIGAAAGGGLGAGANSVTRGQQVQIPSESLIAFRLSSPLTLRIAATPSRTDSDSPLQRRPTY